MNCVYCKGHVLHCTILDLNWSSVTFQHEEQLYWEKDQTDLQNDVFLMRWICGLIFPLAYRLSRYNNVQIFWECPQN